MYFFYFLSFKAFCQAFNSKLAEPKTQEEVDFLSQQTVLLGRTWRFFKALKLILYNNIYVCLDWLGTVYIIVTKRAKVKTWKISRLRSLKPIKNWNINIAETKYLWTIIRLFNTWPLKSNSIFQRSCTSENVKIKKNPPNYICSITRRRT